MQKKQIKLISMFQLMTITALVSLALIIMLLHIVTRSREFEQRAVTMRADYVEQQKALIKGEVAQVVALISEKRSQRERETKFIVKQRVYEASAVAENIYQKNKGTNSKEEIQSMIIDALRAVRFAQGSGYYFMTRLDGIEILFADKPELEGENLLNLQDTKGKYVIKDMIEIARQSGEGFYEYHWTKPTVAGNNFQKISYIKLFEPFGWFIGTGLYVEDVEAQIKNDLLVDISKIRFGDDGYIFINRLNGDALVANGNLISGRRKLWEVFAKNPDKTKALFAQEYDAALKVGGDYIYYSMSKLTEPDKEFPKTSFIYGIPELQWLVGAGVYLDTVEVNIAALQAGLQQQKRSEIQKTILVTGVVIVLILFMFRLLSARLKKDFILFVSFFDRGAHEGKEIDRAKIYFDELSQIAESANTMLHDKQLALEKMRESEEKYRGFFDTAMVGFFRSRLSDGLYLSVNATAAEQIGYKTEEIIGKIKTIDLFQNISQREELLRILERKGFVNDFEVNLLLPNGREGSYSISVKAYPDRDYMEGIAIDISERKRAQVLLKESEERFRNMAELLPEPIFEIDMEMALTYANLRASELFGFTEEDYARGLGAADMFAPEEMPTVIENAAIRFRGEKKKHTEYRCLKRDGTSFQALFHMGTIVKDGQPWGLRGVVIDLTEQKRAAALLQESEERFRELADLLPGAVYEHDSDLNLTYTNQRALELFGYSAEDIVRGVNGFDMFAPEERLRVAENIAAQHRGEMDPGIEYLALKKDGSTFPAFFSSNPIIRNGKTAGRRGVVIDLTKQKQAEEEILQLRKLESVGVLAGGIAHDFNNLLAGLFGNLEMAKRFLSDEHKSYKYLVSAGMSMERATALTQQLLTFAKGGDPIKETLSLAGIIIETAEFSLRGSNVKLQLDIDPNLWLVAADKGQLSQVISNLVINAKQAMPDGGNVVINAENIEVATGKQVQIVVRDQGIGIAPQHLDKIFDPYFSTKQQGSGLGLASCYSIITKHNGTITVESELNRGTTFTMILPAVNEPVETPVSVPEDKKAIDSTTAHILILDDEELLRHMSGAMLEEMGHRVDYAACGEEAVKKYQIAHEEGREYDVILCDLTIPGGMGGQEAAQKILKLDPQAKLIVSSGYATDPVMANYVEYGFRGRVTKPYRFAELQQVLQQVLTVGV
ncbi:MAG: cache domain-containing protein [Thermodesulfobacteriota bacterium]|nr:cache domain-containing protein [Thermodesulfobacteriota bacterium]